MSTATDLTPLPELRVSPLLDELGAALLDLLRDLAPADWERPTVCPAWRVRDVAAHLLDSGVRRLSFGRDGLPLLAPDRPIESDRTLVDFLNRVNAVWVETSRQLSPRVLVELLEVVERELPAHLAEIDHDGPALFSVSWAGEDASHSWFDVARELTERWLHQQQIRQAVGAPPLDGPPFWVPVLETFLRVLPWRYREIAAAAGTCLHLRVEAAVTTDHVLQRTATGWVLLRGEPSAPLASVGLGFETAWRIFSKGIDPQAAERAATVHGDAALATPLFDAVAVMA